MNKKKFMKLRVPTTAGAGSLPHIVSIYLSVCLPVNTLGPALGEAGIQLDHSPAEQRPESEGRAP